MVDEHPTFSKVPGQKVLVFGHFWLKSASDFCHTTCK